MIAQDHPLLVDLIQNEGRPCLSLYVPAHRTQPERRDDLTKYRVLTKQLQESLEKAYESADVKKLMRPFLEILDDDKFWNNRKEGIAVFGSPDFSVAYHLERKVPEIAIVAESFHLKPLLRIVQTLESYHVLGVNRERVALYGGDRDGLTEIDLPDDFPKTIQDALGEDVSEKAQTVESSGGAARVHGHSTTQAEIAKDTEKFFRVVDQAVHERYSKPSNMPLILAGLPQQLSVFHKIRKNPNVLLESITSHPEGLTRDELAKRAWDILEPYKIAQSKEQIERFMEAMARGTALAEPEEIAKAAVEGRVDALMVQAARQVPGIVNKSTGEVQFDDLNQPDVDDLLDDIAEIVLKMKGRVTVLDGEHMPTDSGAAALLRY